MCNYKESEIVNIKFCVFYSIERDLFVNLLHKTLETKDRFFKCLQNIKNMRESSLIFFPPSHKSFHKFAFPPNKLPKRVYN